MASGNIVTLETLAEFYEVDIRTIQLWDEKASENKMPSARIERGKYDFVIYAKNIYKTLKDQNELLKSSGDEKLHALKMDGQRISNRERELKLRRLTGELVNFDKARHAWLDETTIIRRNILSLVPKLTTALENVTETHKKKQLILEQIHAVLNEIGELKIDLTEEEEEENDTTLIDELSNVIDDANSN